MRDAIDDHSHRLEQPTRGSDASRERQRVPASRHGFTTSLGHHAKRLSGALRSRQASPLRSDPFGAGGLDRSSGPPRLGNYVMAGTL